MPAALKINNQTGIASPHVISMPEFFLNNPSIVYGNPIHENYFLFADSLSFTDTLNSSEAVLQSKSDALFLFFKEFDFNKMRIFLKNFPKKLGLERNWQGSFQIKKIVSRNNSDGNTLLHEIVCKIARKKKSCDALSNFLNFIDLVNGNGVISSKSGDIAYSSLSAMGNLLCSGANPEIENKNGKSVFNCLLSSMKLDEINESINNNAKISKQLHYSSEFEALSDTKYFQSKLAYFSLQHKNSLISAISGH